MGVENVVISTEGLQEEKTQILNGTAVKKCNSNLILTNLPIDAWKMIFKKYRFNIDITVSINNQLFYIIRF